ALGAYYPMMGDLNTGLNRTALSQFKVQFTDGVLASGNYPVMSDPRSAVSLGSLKQNDVNGIKALFDTANGQVAAASDLIARLDAAGGEQTLTQWMHNNDAGQPRASGGLPGQFDWMNAS